MSVLNPYEAILFDLDGVLADTREWVVTAFEHTASLHGLTISDSTLTKLFGQPLRTCYDSLGGAQNVELCAEAHRSYQWENMHLVTVFDGVYVLLDEIRSRGIRCAIVTGRTMASGKDTLDRLHLTHYFDSIVTADRTLIHKPHAEPINLALMELGITADRALMVGDAEADILAGKSAGCDTAAALYGFVGDGLKTLNPTYLLDRPLDLLDHLR
jgi:pyrophosphatase PpaX